MVTRGAQGSTILADGRRLEIQAVAPKRLLDPTGCGDAYRAGLLHGLMLKLAWEETGRLASLLGSIKIAHQGTQNHHFTPADLAAEFKAEFGHAITL